MISTLSGKTQEADNIQGFKLKIPGRFSYKPGQYVMISLAEQPETRKAFSIVDFDNNEIHIVVKKRGDFTSRLFSLPLGTEINVFGPYGRFILPEQPFPLIFLAGGIGITPLYSMMKHAFETNYENRIYLLYSTRTRNDMALYKQLSSIEDTNLNKKFIFTSETGRLNMDMLSNIPEFAESMFYICGPPQMVEGLREQLLSMGINEEMIRSEEF